jgi:hypothetical protein
MIFEPKTAYTGHLSNQLHIYTRTHTHRFQGINDVRAKDSIRRALFRIKNQDEDTHKVQGGPNDTFSPILLDGAGAAVEPIMEAGTEDDDDDDDDDEDEEHEAWLVANSDLSAMDAPRCFLSPRFPPSFVPLFSSMLEASLQ